MDMGCFRMVLTVPNSELTYLCSMSKEKKKGIKKVAQIPTQDDNLKIEMTFEQAIKATMIAADKKTKKGR